MSEVRLGSSVITIVLQVSWHILIDISVLGGGFVARNDTLDEETFVQLFFSQNFKRFVCYSILEYA